MIEFGLKDAIDILCVAFLLYYIYKLMKDSGSLYVFYGILMFIITWIFVSQVFEMKLMGSIFDKLVSVGALAIIILFQDDIRRFFISLGSHRKLTIMRRMFRKRKEKEAEDINPLVLQIVMACDYMSKNFVGALIVIERDIPLKEIINSGEYIDAKINTELIKNIFFKNSPLHDGAMIISQNRITAAGCILPVSHSLNIPKDLGLRHRAALGVSQHSDAIAVIVSEETGSISIAQRGDFKLHLAGNELESYLSEALKKKP